MKLRIQAEDAFLGTWELPAEATGQSLAQVLEARCIPLNLRCGERGLCRGCEIVLRSGQVRTPGGLVEGPATVRACAAYPAGEAVLEVPRRARRDLSPQICESFVSKVTGADFPLFPPKPGQSGIGFAVDLGTTTVAVLLVDLRTGAIVSRASAFNAQIRYGDNVLTRIAAAGDLATRIALRRAVVGETLRPLLERACREAGCAPSTLVGGTVAGNTTMLHLLAGEDPCSLGVAPFTPRFLESRRMTWAQLGGMESGGGFRPETPVQLMPGVAAYIGADIAAGIVASNLLYARRPTLLVDIGTNGEVVLQTGDRLLACATAAGPAFEGAGLCGGVRAREGAVDSIRLDPETLAAEVTVLGGRSSAQADGICGSGYLDFLAEGRRVGLLTSTGRFQPDAWKRLPHAAKTVADGVHGFRLVPGGGKGTPQIREDDIAHLLQAKAAIAAGIETLLEVAGLRARDLDRVYLAGGFGRHLRVENAIGCGLLPDVHPEQVEVLGNTSLAGAVLTLRDASTLETLEGVRRLVEVVELNLQPDFEDCYIDHLSLP